MLLVVEVPVLTCHGYAVAAVATTVLFKCHAVVVHVLYPTVVPVHYQSAIVLATRVPASRHV